MACFPACFYTKIRAVVFGDRKQDETLPDGTAHDLSQPTRYFTIMREAKQEEEGRKSGAQPLTADEVRSGLSPDLNPDDICKVVKIPLNASPDSPVLGSWHMTPINMDPEKPFILYLHGVTQTRGYTHRVQLYKKLLKAGYQVLAIDYRGFADSTEIRDITETTVVEDSRVALQYVRKELNQTKVLVWAHSMGCAISQSMMAKVHLDDFEKIRLILETPFSNMRDQVPANTGCAGKALMGCFGLQNLDMEFQSTRWLGQIKCPVMILHPEDDATIPVELSRKLYNEAVKCGKKDIARVTFDKKFEYGHSGLWEHEGLMDFADKFWKGSIEYNDSQSVKMD